MEGHKMCDYIRVELYPGGIISGWNYIRNIWNYTRKAMNWNYIRKATKWNYIRKAMSGNYIRNQDTDPEPWGLGCPASLRIDRLTFTQDRSAQ